jgi:DNA invertase Pin-like site-specific DNA recombinase
MKKSRNQTAERETMIAAYIRVSTEKQADDGSVRSQKLAINRWLRGHNIEPKDVQYFEDVISGTTHERPALAQLEGAIFNGEVSQVVVFSLSRVSRRGIVDGMKLLGEWLEKGVRVVSVSEQFDFTGQVGQLIASVFFAMAKIDQDNRKLYQAAGIARAKEEGKYQGRKSGTTIAKPARARQLKDKGNTYEEIASSLGVSRATVARYLSATR